MRSRALKKKEKTTHEISPLSAAVKHVREAWGDTQERFARRIGVAVMTVSHFETGRTEPRDPRVLRNLATVAMERMGKFEPHTEAGRNVIAACELFHDAYEDWERLRRTDEAVAKLEPHIQPAFLSVREWRLVCATRLALRYYPECIGAIEKAAAPAIALVDQVLSGSDENRINYQQYERDVFALAERQTLKDLKNKDKQE
jgi:DNA-binding transcriptional regulator YiaG